MTASSAPAALHRPPGDHRTPGRRRAARGPHRRAPRSPGGPGWRPRRARPRRHPATAGRPPRRLRLPACRRCRMSGLQAVRAGRRGHPPGPARTHPGREVAHASLAPATYHLAGPRPCATPRPAPGPTCAARRPPGGRPTPPAPPGVQAPGGPRPLAAAPAARTRLRQCARPAARLRHRGTHYPISHSCEHIPVHLLGPDAELDQRNPGVPAPPAPPRPWCRSSSTARTSTCGLCSPTGCGCGCCATPPPWPDRPTSSSTSKPSSRASCTPSSCSCASSRTSPGWRSAPGPTAPRPTAGSRTGAARPSQAGTRALDRLRDGVETAIGALGTGFLRHPANGWLVGRAAQRELTDREYHRALLRLVYRLLFTFVAEDRDALLDPAATPRRPRPVRRLLLHRPPAPALADPRRRPAPRPVAGPAARAGRPRR